MALSNSSLYEFVYDGSTNPDQFHSTIVGLQTGKLYKFRVYSLNFNGLSQPSADHQVYACGLPSFFDKPRYVSSTKTSITLDWDEPQNNGGCEVFDYGVYRDMDGTGNSVFVNVNPAASYIRNDPQTTIFTVTQFPALHQVGDFYKFYISATNLQGTINSQVSNAIQLAGIPATPTIAPARDNLYSDDKRITVQYTTVADDGGSSLVSFEL
jgi:hypothetical protein